MLAFFVFIAASNTSINTVYGQNCPVTTETDQMIVKSIYEKIKSNTNLAAQVTHINVTSTNLIVKITGWVNNTSDYNKVINSALKTDCVKLLNVNSFSDSKPSENLLNANCAPGTKPCFDICIPQDDSCNITKP